MTTLSKPLTVTIYQDARTILRALSCSPMPWSHLVAQLFHNSDRTINAIDHCMKNEWIERRTRQVKSDEQASDFIITPLGRRIA